jgi:hypothetical protein
MRVIVARSNSFIPSKCKKATLMPRGKVSFKNDVVAGATKTPAWSQEKAR